MWNSKRATDDVGQAKIVIGHASPSFYFRWLAKNNCYAIHIRSTMVLRLVHTWIGVIHITIWHGQFNACTYYMNNRYDLQVGAVQLSSSSNGPIQGTPPHWAPIHGLSRVRFPWQFDEFPVQLPQAIHCPKNPSTKINGSTRSRDKHILGVVIYIFHWKNLLVNTSSLLKFTLFYIAMYPCWGHIWKEFKRQKIIVSCCFICYLVTVWYK